MKRKLLLACCALLLGWSNASAQTEWTGDVTNGEGLNYSNKQQFNGPSEKKNGAFECWTNNAAASFDFNQSFTSVPDGVYELSSQAMYRASLTYGTPTNSVLYATVGDKTFSTPLANLGDYTASEDPDKIGLQMTNNNAYLNIVPAVMVEGGNVTIGMKSLGALTFCTNGYWIVFKKSTFTFKNVTTTYHAKLVARATTMLATAPESSAKTTLSNALTTYADATYANVKALQSAINTFLATATETNPLNVTDYITNPSFSDDSGNKKNWIQDLGYKQPGDIYQPTGWNMLYSSAKVNNTQYQTYKTQTDGAKDNNCYYVRHRWGDVYAKVSLHQLVKELPAGKYQLTVAVKGGSSVTDPNSLSMKAGSKSGTTEVSDFDKSNYKDYSVQVTKLNADDDIDISFSWDQKTGVEQLYYVDDFRMYYLGDPLPGLKKELEDLQASIDDSYLNNSTYTNVIGTERANLISAKTIPAAEETVDAYQDAIDAVQDAIDAFTTAKTNYDEYAEAVTIASTIGATGVTVPTTASDALTRAHELNVNINTKVNSTYTYDVTSIYVGGWSRSNLDDNTTGQHWSGDKDKTYMDKWLGSGSSSASQTIHLPAGEYILKVAGRGQANATTITMSAAGNSVTFRSKGDSGVGIDRTGAANFASADDTYCNDNNGRGWEWRFIPLSLDAATDITVTLNIARTSGSWASFSDFTILMSSTDADPDDYTALNSAISNAESLIIGFEDGEYAPYNNVNALTKLALAKRINPDETNPKGAVTAATAELTGATWTANATDVDAVFNGSFSSDVEGDWGLTGWTRTNAWGQQRNDLPNGCGSTTNYGYYNQPGSLKYGNTGAYIMPLKANTIYNLTFKYASWEADSNNGMTVSVLNSEDGMAAMAFPENNTQYKSSEAFAVKTLVFATGAAGNYVLTLENSGNTVITDVSITKAASQVLEFVDGSAVPAYAPGTYPSVKITRSLTANRWATAVYPFAVSGVNNIAVLNSYNSSTGELGFTSAAASTANEPFLMRSTDGVTKISLSDVEVAAIAANPVATKNEASLIGAYTTTAITNAEKNYVLSENNIYSVGVPGATINPYRAYIQIDEGSSVKVLSFIVDGTATGVEAPEVTEAEEEEILYNTAGVRVGKDYKGIVINQKGEKRLQK